MDAYQRYFECQRVSGALHQRLLELEGRGAGTPALAEKKGRRMRFGALAACLALLIGVGYGGLKLGSGPVEPAPQPMVTQPAEGGDEDFWARGPGGVPGGGQDAAPAQTDSAGGGDRAGFVAAGAGEDSDKLMFPILFSVDYADVSANPHTGAASLALPKGSFFVPLSKGDIQKVFWGEQGKPPVTNPKTDTGDFPLYLMGWQGYTITGQVCYDGEGELYQLWVRGEKGEDSFVLTLCPGRIPPECVLEPGRATTDVNGLEVAGWRRSYDCDGDGAVEHIVVSSFLVEDYGVTFRNIGSGGSRASEADGGEATDLGGAELFNAMLVTFFSQKNAAPYVEHLLHAGNIPAWQEEAFESLDAALAGAERFAQGHPEADFARYLPAGGPQGYGVFSGHLSYQEGRYKQLWVRWSEAGGYDDVEVWVQLPEGDGLDGYAEQLVDVAVPESYDWRLYDGPISETVPEEYRYHFYKPVFRAEDMSLEVVQARMADKDTGGQSCRFYVIYQSGAVVDYSCAGVSAQYVWSLVEATLN